MRDLLHKQLPDHYVALGLALALAGLHVLLSLWLSSNIGILQVFQDHLFLGPDPKEYWHVGSALLGEVGDINIRSFELRPFLYPLYLGLAMKLGPRFYLLVQLVLLFFTIFFLMKTLLNIYAPKRILVLGALFTCVSATLLMAPYTAMSETFCVFLVSAFVYSYTTSFRTAEKHMSLFVSIALLSLSVCVKGIFLPFLVFFVLFHLVTKEITLSRRSLVLLLIALSPLLVQLLISYHYTGSAFISRAGSINFSWRFFPMVYGHAEFGLEFTGYASSMAKQAQADIPQLADQIRYVLSHPKSVLDIVWRLWRMNYLHGGQWLFIPDARGRVVPDQLTVFQRSIWDYTIYINTAIMWLHIVLVPMILGYCIRWRYFWCARWLLMLSLLQLSIFLTSVLVYFQADRIVLVSLPIYAVIYPFFFMLMFYPRKSELRARVEALGSQESKLGVRVDARDEQENVTEA